MHLLCNVVQHERHAMALLKGQVTPSGYGMFMEDAHSSDRIVRQ